MITEESVQDVVRRIVEKVHPQKIVAFGSWAEGRAGKDSDLDLLVIMPLKAGESRRMKAGEVRGIVHDSPFPMDIIVYAPETVEKRISQGDYFLCNILQDGRILHSS
jgi:uncharacterized protein